MYEQTLLATSADDTTILCHHKITKTAAIQLHLFQIETCFSKWKIALNKKKNKSSDTHAYIIQNLL